MHIIDQYAYSNRIRAVDPAQKAGLAVAVLLLVLVLDTPAVSLVAIGWMWLLATRVAGLSARTFGRVLVAEAFFLTLATVGVAIGASGAPPPNPQAVSLQLGPLWLFSSSEMLLLALGLVLRALGAASAMNFLTLTTPLIDLVDLLRRLRVPALLIDLMTVIYRFIFVLLESLNQMYTAQESRLGYSSYRRAMISAGLLGSQLFIDTYRRSQQLQIALESRGYSGGALTVLPTIYYRDTMLTWASLVAVATLLAIWMVL